MVHGLSVSDADDPLALRTGVGDQIIPLAASVGAGGGGPVGSPLEHVVSAATGDVSLDLSVHIFSSASGHTHCLATQRTHWDCGL